MPYAAKLEKDREWYKETKANNPEKHAARLEKQRESGRKRRLEKAKAREANQTAEELEAIQRAKLAAKQRAPTKAGDTYSVVFHSRELGLNLVQVNFKGSPLTLVSKADGTFCMCNGRPIKSDTLIRRNDVLLSVAGKRVVGSPMNEVAALLSSSPRPVTLEFRPRFDESNVVPYM